MVTTQNYKIILTGGPVGGKSDVLRAAKELGYAVVPESARDVIRAHGITGPNLQDILPYRQSEYEHVYTKSGITLLDRSHVDNKGYANHFGIPPADSLDALINAAGYHSDVLFLHLPPNESLFEAIVGKDPDRVEDYATALAIQDSLRETYLNHGFTLHEIGWQDKSEDKVKLVLQYLRGIENGN